MKNVDRRQNTTSTRSLIARLRDAAGLDRSTREAMSELEGRQLLAAATITGTAANQSISDSSTTNLFSGVTVADIDSSILSVEVQIDNSAKGVFTSGSVTDSGFTDAGSGRYTYFGSPSEATTALRALVFNPADNRVPVNFSETSRFTITVDDATDLTTDNTTTVRSISSNDSPSSTGFTTSTTINDTATTTPFSGVTITDPDPFQTLSVVVTLDAAAKGGFTAGSLTSSGFTAAGGGIYTVSGRAANVTTAIRELVFQPTQNRVAVASTETTTFQVTVTDSIASAVSDSTTTVISTSVNNAPTIAGTTASQGVLDNATISPFTGVTFADVDPATTLNITVELDVEAKGAFTAGSLSTSGFTDATGGVYTFVGTATAATTAIRALVFQPTADRVLVGSSETTTFTISADDSVAAAVTDTTTTVVSSPFNNATTITGTSASQAVNDTGTLTPFSAVTIADVDSPAQTLTLTVTLDSTSYGDFTGGSVSGAGFTDAGGGVYTRTGTASQLTTAIRALSFAATVNTVAIGSTQTVGFSVSVDDGIITPTTDTTTTVVITPVNDAASIGGAVASQATNDNANVSPFSSITFSDADAPAQTFTVTVALDTAAKGVFTSASLTTAGFTDAGGGSYTKTGTLASLQTAIRALSYNPTDNRVAVASTETTTFTITLSDGVAADVTNSTTTVVSTSVNVAPTIGGAASGQTVDDNATVSPFTLVTFGDDDNNTLDITVSIDTEAKGVFTPGSLSASGFVSAGGGNYTFSGTPAAATTAIRALIFAPTVNRSAVGASETSTFTISADDTIAAATTDSTTTVISSAYNDASTIGGTSASQAVNDTTTITPFSAVTIADADSPAQTLTLTVTLDTAAKGIFTSGSLSASGFNDDGGGVYSRTGTASQLQTAVRQLVFNPADNRVAAGSTETTTFTISVTDGLLSAVTDNTTTAVSTSVNDAPVIAGTSSGQTVNDTANVSPFSAVTFADADTDATLTVTITLDTAAKGVFTPASLTSSGFVDAGSGVYTFTGTPAAATTAIQALVFDATNNRVAAASTETTTFTVAIDDGATGTDSDAATTVVSTSMNDAPTITGAVASQPVNDNATITPFAAMTIADVDPSTTLSITVSLDDAAKGAFTSGSLTDSGFVDAGGGSYTFSGTGSAATTAIRQLIFAPTANRGAVGSTETTTFTVTADDAVASPVNDTTATAVSTSINDAPTVGSATAGQTVNDNSTLSPFSSVTIGDADSPAQTLTLTVTLDAHAKGAFTSGSIASAGFTDQGLGVYTRTGTASALTTAIRALVFNPTDDRVAVASTETTTFTIGVTDTSGGSVSNTTTTVVSTSINDAPSVSVGVSSQAVNDTATVLPFSTMIISDADSTQTLTVTVSIDTAAKGVFTSESLTASGFVSAGGGNYTFTGTRGDATTAIRQLAFAPTDNRVNVGTTETTTFTVTANDAVAAAASDAATTVISTSMNDAPAVSGTAASQAVNDTATVMPFATVTITDADTDNQSIALTLTIDTAAKGSFTSGSLSGAGFTDAGGGTYTRSGTAAALTAAIRTLVFQPAANRITAGSTETTTFQLGFNDGAGGTSSNSSSTVVSTSINDAPTVTGAVASQAVNDNATLTPFSGVTIADVDPNTNISLTVTIDTAAKGIFTSASLTSSGFTNAGGGAYTFNGTPAAATTAIRALVFNATDNRGAVASTETSTFTIAINDSVGGSDSNSTTTVVSTSINDAPTITGVADTTVLDNATIAPFASVTIADPDSPAQNQTVTIALSDSANGAFTSASLTASGFTNPSAGVYTFTGTASAATTAIRQLIFQPVENRVLLGSTETTAFDVDVNDTVTTTNDATTDVVVSPYNNLASITGTSGSQGVSDTGTVTPFSSVTITDADSPAHMLTLSVVLSNPDGGTFTEASLASSGFTMVSSNTYSFTAIASAVTAAVRTLVFQPAQNRVAVGSTETSYLGLMVTDSVDGVNVIDTSTSVVSTSINNAPTITGTVASQSINDNTSAALFGTVTVGDVDPSTTVTLNVTIGNTVYGSFTGASISASGMTFVSGGTYTFTGTAAAATTAIRQLVYQPTANAAVVGDVFGQAFVFDVNDQAVTSLETIYLDQTSVNDAPTITGATSGQAVNDNATNTPFSGLTLADVDVSQSLTVTVTVGNTAKGDFTSGSVSTAGFTNAGSGVYTFTGSASAATTAIRQLTFAPTANRVAVGSTETSTFTVTVNDGVASNVTDTTTTVISTSINNAPTISGATAGQAVNDNSTNTPFSGLTLADVDPSQDVIVRVTVGNTAKGDFTSGSVSTAGFTNAGSGVYTFTGSATAATTAIRQLTFAPTANRVAVGSTETSTFTVTVDDSVTSQVSDTTTTVISTSINNAPTISGSTAGQAVNDNATNTPFSGLTLADVDPSQNVTVTVTVGNTAKGDFTSGSVTTAGFTNAGSGVYIFTGLASAATTAIRQLTFAPTANRVAVGSTETSTFTVTVNDGVASNVTDTTTTVISTSINNAPTVTGAQTSQAVNDNATITPFSTVTVGDVDPSQNVTLFVAQWGSSTGSFTSASVLAAGFTDTGGGTLQFTGTAAAATTAIRQLVFTPTANRVSVGTTDTSTFSVIVYDALGTSAGATASAVATSINDAPTLSGATTGQSVNDNATLQPFGTISIGDVDPSQSLSVFVSQWSTAAGGFTSGSISAAGFTDLGGGTFRFTGSASAATTAVRTLVYRPTANRVAPGSTEASTFSVIVYDAQGQSVGGTASAVSTSINDAPTVTGTGDSGTVLDTQTASPFASTTIADVDVNGLVAVTVSLDSAAKGAFTSESLVTSGFSDAGNGAYTFIGSASQATAAIRALVFAPTLNRLGGGATETTTFTISVSDGSAPLVADSGSTIISQGVNNAPAVGGLASSLASVRIGQAFSLTATGVADGDGTVTSVEFWRDADNDNALTEADELVGTATSGSGSWSISATVADAWGTGTQRFFAAAVDNDGDSSNAATTQVNTLENTGALIVALTSTRSSATFNQSFTLTANDVTASSGTIRNVAFFFDSNADGVWDSRDKKLATDTSATGGYTATVKVPTTWSVGQHLIFARATDSAGIGSPVSFAFTVAANVAPNAGTIISTPSTVPSNNKVTLTLSGSSDEDGSIKSVAWFADTNGNGIWDAADRRLGSGSNATNFYRLATTLTRSWARDNAFIIFARATDNNGAIGTSSLSLPIAA